ncbi:MAG: hypothetical protein HY471_02415 [Candidatus Sungbacteria bacterium]|nr:hypothetical protein [Candidatus Sungbacteria bacterium]
MKSFTLALLAFLVFTPTLAHEGDHITYKDLGGEPVIIPSHPLYPLKEIRRTINRALASGAEQKIAVELKIAKERLAEIKKLVEEDTEAAETLERAEARYRIHFETMQKHFASLSEKNKNAEQLIEKLGDIAEKHFLVFEEVRERTGRESREAREATEMALSQVAKEAMRINKDKAKKAFKLLWEKEKQKESTTTVEILLKELEDLYEERIRSKPPTAEEPAACIQVYDPVCGIDGKTYANSCFARLANVAIQHTGECVPERRSSTKPHAPANVSEKTNPEPPQAVTPPSTPTTASKIVDAKIANFAFDKEIRIRTGDTIRWTNTDGVGHTVTSDTGVFRSNLLPTDGSFSFIFKSAGSFPYFCEPHPFMRGTIIVE